MLKAWSARALVGARGALGMWGLMGEYPAIWGYASGEASAIPAPSLRPPPSSFSFPFPFLFCCLSSPLL